MLSIAIVINTPIMTANRRLNSTRVKTSNSMTAMSASATIVR